MADNFVCPRCKRKPPTIDLRVQQGRLAPTGVSHGPEILGCRATGQVEDHITRACNRAQGCGFVGYRGLVECLDCGHKWYSSRPGSGARALPDHVRRARP